MDFLSQNRLKVNNQLWMRKKNIHNYWLYLIQIFGWNILKEEGMVQALSVNIYTAKVGKGYICVMLSTEQRSFTQSIYSSFSSFQSWPKLQCLNPERMVRNLQLYKQTEIKLIQVNIFQKHLILHQLTHIMTKDCSFNYEFITWKLQAHLLTWIILNDKNKNKKTICVLNL